MSEVISPYIGVKPPISTDSNIELNTSLIESLVQTGYDYVLIPITNAQYRQKSKEAFHLAKNEQELKVPSPSISDVNLFVGAHMNNTIGLVSSWIELESDNQLIAEFSRQVLIHELEYAKFLGLKNLIIAPPKDLLKLSNYSKKILEALTYLEGTAISLSISLPICENFEDTESNDPFSTWDMWNSIRTSVAMDVRLKVSLALSKKQTHSKVIARWFAEPVSHVLMSSSVFLLNHKGYPVLSKPNQELLHQFQLKAPVFLLHGVEKTPEDLNPSLYMQYINYIILKNQPKISKMDQFGMKHNDVLLPPLQPLKNNLTDFTYSIFEQDYVKYEMYGKAIHLALTDLSHLSSINIAIVGAGKGGLVQVAYDAVNNIGLQTKSHIVAVEKNSSALVYLEKRNIGNWKGTVDILDMDMRNWTPKETQQLIISELLGSFGCNELSPECLSRIEKFLHPSNGVFIPQSYASHIAPAFTPKIHKHLKDLNKPGSFDQQYVVKMFEHCLCSNKINEVWKFEHPSPNNHTLRRNAISTFKIRYKTVIHGIIGYFTATLYKDIELSIKPDSFTKDLISWFPYFFPLETPLYVSDDTELEISISREARDGKVWYTWALESFIYLVIPSEKTGVESQMRIRTNISKIHNHNGEGVAIEEISGK